MNYLKIEINRRNLSALIIEGYFPCFIFKTPICDNHVTSSFYKLSDSQKSILVGIFHVVSILIAINRF